MFRQISRSFSRTKGMSKEHLYYEEYPEIYEKFPEKRQSRARGANTLSENFKKLRAFFNWALAEDPEYRSVCRKNLVDILG